MATGRDFVYGALRKAGVRTAESPIEPFELSEGLEVFNDMMAELEPVIHLGFKPIANATDEVRVPRGTHDGIKAMLAIRLAPDYEKVPGPALVATAEAAINNILTANVSLKESHFPDTLPIGSGNECHDGDYYDQRFFPDPAEDDC